MEDPGQGKWFPVPGPVPGRKWAATAARARMPLQPDIESYPDNRIGSRRDSQIDHGDRQKPVPGHNCSILCLYQCIYP